MKRKLILLSVMMMFSAALPNNYIYAENSATSNSDNTENSKSHPVFSHEFIDALPLQSSNYTILITPDDAMWEGVFPSTWLLEYTITDEAGTETSDKKTFTSPSMSLRITGKTNYDSMSRLTKKYVNYVLPSRDAQKIKIKYRGGLISASNAEVWDDYKEFEVDFYKEGVGYIDGTETLDLFTYDYPTQFYVGPKVIPYDSTLHFSEISKEDNDKIKTLLGQDDFAAFSAQLLDSDGNLQENMIPTSIYSSWADITTKGLILPEINNYDVTNLKIYRYDGSQLVEQTYQAGTIDDSSARKGHFAFYVDQDILNGIYVFVPQECRDISDAFDGWYAFPSSLVENDDHLSKNANDDILADDLVYSYQNNGTITVYARLNPLDGNYAEEISSYNSKTNTYEDVSVVETVEINGKKYPKTIKVTLPSNSAYLPLKFKIAGNEQSASLAINATIYDSHKLTTKPVFLSPEISVTNSEGNPVSKFLNDAEAKISITAPSVNGSILYSVTDSNGEIVIDETNYTEPFLLSTTNEEGETYTVNAYVSANDDDESSLGASQKITKEVSFSAKGAYAETSATPVIGTQYISGESLEDSIFKVVISSETEGASIYYTTDGTEPTAGSNLYNGSFEVPGSTNGNATVIKAFAVKEGTNDSETIEKAIVFNTDWWDNILPNTQYSVPVKMVQWANPAALSMGNGAIAGDATLTVDRNGNKTMTIPFQEINIGTSKGHVVNFWYFPNKADFDSDNWQQKLTNDSEYTYSSAGLIDSVTFPVYNSDELIPTALRSNADFMGNQRTYIKADYSSIIKDVTGEDVSVIEVDAPIITPTVNADGVSYDIELKNGSNNVNANIYYMISKSDSWDDSAKKVYTDKFIVTKDDADENGIANVLAVAVDGENQSVVNIQKLYFSESGDVVEQLADGVYTVPVSIKKLTGDEDGNLYPSDEDSMANDALNGEAVLTVNNGTYTYELPFKSKTLTLDGQELIGHLTSLYTYPGTDNTASLRTEAKAYDKTRQLGLNNATKYYPTWFAFSRAQKDSKIMVCVRVDAMDQISATGEMPQDAFLVFDWDNAKKLDDNTLYTLDNGSRAVYLSGSDTYIIAGVSKDDLESTDELVVELGKESLYDTTDTVYSQLAVDDDTIINASDFGADYLYAIKISNVTDEKRVETFSVTKN